MYISILKTKRKIDHKKNSETNLELVGLPVLYPLVLKYWYFNFFHCKCLMRYLEKNPQCKNVERTKYKFPCDPS